jgi:hypothetical protein
MRPQIVKPNRGASTFVLISQIDGVQPFGSNRDLIEVTSAGEPIRDCRVKRSRCEGVEQFSRREGAELKPQNDPSAQWVNGTVNFPICILSHRAGQFPNG